jgi:hypothetical protein
MDGTQNWLFIKYLDRLRHLLNSNSAKSTPPRKLRRKSGFYTLSTKNNSRKKACFHMLSFHFTKIKQPFRKQVKKSVY